MPFDPTDEQRAVLGHDVRRHARLLAGPGTGKSATIVALVGQLLADERRPRIKLLTFTRAATAELAKKLTEHPAAIIERPSTIHSFAVSVLLRNHGVGGLPEPFRIADAWEYKNIVRPVLARRARVGVYELDRLVQEMSAGWESLQPRPNPRVAPEVRARFHGAWEEHSRAFGYTHPAEFPFALRGALRDGFDLQELDYDLLVVDEYQDLNACDLDMLRLIAARGCAIIAAGDDDQSIYSFRMAAPEGIRRFPADYPGAIDYPLTLTQRCARNIVAWANHVILGDPDRPPGRGGLNPTAAAPLGVVALLSFANELREAEGIASLVAHLVNNEGVPATEILILLRGDHNGTFSSPIRRELTQRGIPFSDPSAVERLLAEPANRRLLEVLRLLVNREDSLAWASLLELAAGVGRTFSDYVYERARTARVSFGSALLRAAADGFPGAPTSARIVRELIRETCEWLEAHPAPDAMPAERWGQWIGATCVGGAAPGPSAELRDLLAHLDGLIETEQGLDRYIGQIGPLGRDWSAAQSPGVRIMTMVSAKGLTVRATIVAGVEDGIVPRPEGDVAEERRLLYVAMTRPREHLYCTWARSRRGPTARAGRARVATPRTYANFLRGGPVPSQEGTRYIAQRWPAR